MGILPLQFKEGESGQSLGLTGSETFTIERDAKLTVNQTVTVKSSTGKSFQCMTRLDTEPEIAYYTNGGILQYVLRKLIAQTTDYKLHYFPFYGRAEPLRMMLTHAGADWDEAEYTFDQWPKYKESMPNGQMPCL